MFGNQGSRPKKKFHDELLYGKPIQPKHERPKAVGDDFPNLVSEEDKRMFVEFADFADVINWWFEDGETGDRWRLREIANTELKLGFHDSPTFGRRYEIYCGPIQNGLLEIQSGYPYDDRERTIWTAIEIQNPRLLYWDSIVGFLSSISAHISGHNHIANNQSAIQNAMTQCLWDSQVISDQDLGLDWGTLELHLQGTADFYFQRSNAFRGRSHSR